MVGLFELDREFERRGLEWVLSPHPDPLRRRGELLRSARRAREVADMIGG